MSTLSPSAPATATDNSDTDQGVEPGGTIEPDGQPDEAAVRELPSASDVGTPEQVSDEQSEEASFGTTSMFDRFKKKASKASKSMHGQLRRVQGRSAARDAKTVREKTERIFSEISATLKGATQTVISGTLGATYGVISGTTKGMLPMHAQTLKAADNLALAGEWTALHKGVETEDGMIDVFDVAFTEEAADRLSLNEQVGNYPVDRAAVHTEIPLDGESVEVVSSPLYDESNDKLVGVLAFVNEGKYQGKILLHLE